MNATLKTILILATLVTGTAHAEELVLRFETDAERDARDGVVTAYDVRTLAGQAQLRRLQGNVRIDPIVERGKIAGQSAVATAGRHAAKITDADVMRRAKTAVKAAKLTGDDADRFVGAFIATFTTVRMNAR
jgi:hypothetical protein